MLGTQEAYDFYQELNTELREKVSEKQGVTEDEKYRLVWGAGLPSWFALGDFQYFNDKGAVFPTETTYRVAEKLSKLDLPKTNDPLEHIAWRFIRYIPIGTTRPGRGPVLYPRWSASSNSWKTTRCDGVVFHSAFSCRSWHAGIIMEAATLRKVYGDIPTLIMEGDIVDISSYNEADTHNRIDAFIEALEGARKRHN